MAPRIFDTIRKKPLDPSRKDVVFATYDEDRGYRTYHERCQSAYKRPIDNPKSDALTEYGLEHLSILDQKVASDALETIIATAQVSVKKENIDYSEMLTVPDRIFIKTLFEKIFTPDLDQKITTYFKSEYCIYWYTILRALPTGHARRSFLWHCDKGPSCHIKLLLYLNGTDEHGGNTIFLDRSTTNAFTKTGYLFGPVDARQSDLSQLAKKYHLDYNPNEWEMNPGDGILFEPSQVLHCGILPTKGPRYVLAFCILPSPIPRHEAFKRIKGDSMIEDYSWHTNADDIRKALLQ